VNPGLCGDDTVYRRFDIGASDLPLHAVWGPDKVRMDLRVDTQFPEMPLRNHSRKFCPE